jgi:ABC-type phosphate transport system auxiliary subunit
MTYQFDAVRWCKARARSARAQRNSADENSFVKVAREVEELRVELKTLRMADDLNQQGAEHMLAELAELQEAVRWERECLTVMNPLWYQEDTAAYMEARASLGAARAAVDALVGERDD